LIYIKGAAEITAKPDRSMLRPPAQAHSTAWIYRHFVTRFVDTDPLIHI
jgi:hypothetical protein